MNYEKLKKIFSNRIILFLVGILIGSGITAGTICYFAAKQLSDNNAKYELAKKQQQQSNDIIDGLQKSNIDLKKQYSDIQSINAELNKQINQFNSNVNNASSTIDEAITNQQRSNELIDDITRRLQQASIKK